MIGCPFWTIPAFRQTFNNLTGEGRVEAGTVSPVGNTGGKHLKKSNKEETQQLAVRGAKQRDIRAKDIFGNPELCAQFLRDYADIPILKHVQPQDIEEAELRHHFFEEAELNSDNVKRIRVKDAEVSGELTELYVVALIEHKSYIDHDVAMQLLRYMVCIWYDWAKEAKNPSEHRKKEFRYPPVIPIVYYEGKQEWTAGLRLCDRVLLGELFQEFIPDFTYRIVENRKYTQEELLLKEDEMSLLMLLNQIQTAEDISILKALPAERLNRIIRHSSEAVLNEVLRAVQGLCRQLNLTESETAEYTQRVKERNMGYLWENAEDMDIQAERRNTAEARKELAEAKKELAETEKNAEEMQKKLHNMYRVLIQAYRLQGFDRETVRKRIINETEIENAAASELLDQYWDEPKTAE